MHDVSRTTRRGGARFISAAAFRTFVRPQSFVAGGALALLSACAADQGLTAPKGVKPTDLRQVIIPAPGNTGPGAQFGFLEICKLADAASTGPVTGNFQFNLSGPNVAAGTSVTVPVGDCSQVIQTNAGAVTITEVRAGFVVSSATATSTIGGANRLVSLVDNTIVVNVDAAADNSLQTVVTVRNRTAGFGTVKVCKLAGPGVAAGTNFTFTVDAAPPVTVAAGACDIVRDAAGNAFQFPQGASIPVTEAAPGSNIGVTAITTDIPARLAAGSVNLANRTANILIGPGETVVNFTNAVQGTIQLCKVGIGTAIGQTFSFTSTGLGGATGTRVAAAAPGTCAQIGGPVTIGTQVSLTEAALAGFELASITGATQTPGTNTGTLTVAAGVNTVTFTNRPVPAPTPVGTVELCKVGILGAQGQSFSFTSTGLGGATATRVASAAPGTCAQIGGAVPVGTVVTITEVLPNPSMFLLLGIQGGTRSGNTATLTVQAGLNRVTFTDFRILRPCTFTQGRFKNREEDVVAALQFGRATNSPLVTATGAIELRVGNQLLDAGEIDAILETPPRGGDARIQLLHQLITAQLNVIAAGGQAPQEVLAAIAAANQLLSDNVISDAERDQARALADVLDRFNNGQFRSGDFFGHCS